MTLDEAKALKIGDRLRWVKHRDNHWVQITHVESRGVVISHYVAGVDIGHRELFDWDWLAQKDHPYTKI